MQISQVKLEREVHGLKSADLTFEGETSLVLNSISSLSLMSKSVVASQALHKVEAVE